MFTFRNTFGDIGIWENQGRPRQNRGEARTTVRDGSMRTGKGFRLYMDACVAHKEVFEVAIMENALARRPKAKAAAFSQTRVINS